MSIRQIVCVCAVVLCGAGIMATDAAGQGVGLTVKTGTLGYGADLSIGLSEHMGIRAGFLTGDLEVKNISMETAKLDGAIECSSVPLMLDIFPAGGSFRFTIGAVINNNKITLKSQKQNSIELQEITYGIDSFDGQIEFDKFSPYIGIGCGNAVSKDGHWYFSCDIGFMYHGQPTASARAVASSSSLQSALDSSLAAELDDLNDNIKWAVLWPVVEFGLSYRF